jgi:hypothetical protein
MSAWGIFLHLQTNPTLSNCSTMTLSFFFLPSLSSDDTCMLHYTIKYSSWGQNGEMRFHDLAHERRSGQGTSFHHVELINSNNAIRRFFLVILCYNIDWNCNNLTCILDSCQGVAIINAHINFWIYGMTRCK